MLDATAIDRIVDELTKARSVTVLTGAGVSAASGVPTFRGAAGLWKSHRAESLATPEAFARNPQLVWEWYQWRRQLIADCEPNPAHRVLASWSRRFEDFTLITQNVDGLHERAGTRNVIRFHGSIWEVQCWSGCQRSPDRWLNEVVPLSEIPPRCPHCAGLLRPGVVWLGEGIRPHVLERALASVSCDVFLSVGTSSLVYPAAALSNAAKSSGATTIEINLEATPVSSQLDIALEGAAETILKQIDDRLHNTAAFGKDA